VPDSDAVQGVTLNAEPVPVGVAMERSSSGELQVKVTLCNLDRDAYFRCVTMSFEVYRDILISIHLVLLPSGLCCA
jgi:hypothetical protein